MDRMWGSYVSKQAVAHAGTTFCAPTITSSKCGSLREVSFIAHRIVFALQLQISMFQHTKYLLLSPQADT